MDDFESSISFGISCRDFSATIGRPIINAYNFDVTQRLGSNRFKTLIEPFRDIVYWDNNGNFCTERVCAYVRIHFLSSFL